MGRVMGVGRGIIWFMEYISSGPVTIAGSFMCAVMSRALEEVRGKMLKYVEGRDELIVFCMGIYMRVCVCHHGTFTHLLYLCFAVYASKYSSMSRRHRKRAFFSLLTLFLRRINNREGFIHQLNNGKRGCRMFHQGQEESRGEITKLRQQREEACLAEPFFCLLSLLTLSHMISGSFFA